jgi:hypothetical protein
MERWGAIMRSDVPPNEIVGERFEQLYRAWSSDVQHNMNPYSSSDRDYIQNPHFEAIVDLGSEALPFIMEKLRSDEHAHFLIHALTRITGMHFSPEEVAASQARAAGPIGNQAMVQLWLSWWES